MSEITNMSDAVDVLAESERIAREIQGRIKTRYSGQPLERGEILARGVLRHKEASISEIIHIYESTPGTTKREGLTGVLKFLGYKVNP